MLFFLYKFLLYRVIIKVIRQSMRGEFMKTKDMLEDYLLSLGVSIKNNYTFLPKTEYDFKEKKNDETVKLRKHTIKLSQQFANSRELRLMLNSAKDNFINKVTITEDMHKSCEGILKNSIIYFTDLIKYLDSILELKPEIMEKLIITICLKIK